MSLFLDKDHKYWDNGQRIPGTTEIIEAVFPFIDRGIVTDRAREFGNAVHTAVELMINGTLDESTVDEVLWPYINQAEKFIMVNGNYTPKTEIILKSPKYNFAGKLDTIMDDVIDWKTGMYLPEHRLKISAYLHLFNSNFPDEKRDKGILVYLNGKDTPPAIVVNQPSDFNVFLCCLEIWKFRRNN